MQKLERASFLTSPDCQAIPPPAAIGRTLEVMFQKGVIFSEQQRKKVQQKSNIVRGWSLGDFWEQTSWPKDSSGNGGVRYGLPVVEDKDLDEEALLSEAPGRQKGLDRIYEEFDPDGKGKPAPTPDQENPFVRNVAGVSGMEEEIMDASKDCILFLSARFCKTCKTISPLYTRMARISKDADSSTLFAKAETSGPWGKELGRALEVDAVPAFVLFRNGERYGSPMSVSRLPSKKIEQALELLESGADWDPTILAEKS